MENENGKCKMTNHFLIFGANLIKKTEYRYDILKKSLFLHKFCGHRS